MCRIDTSIAHQRLSTHFPHGKVDYAALAFEVNSRSSEAEAGGKVRNSLAYLSSVSADPADEMSAKGTLSTKSLIVIQNAINDAQNKCGINDDFKWGYP